VTSDRIARVFSQRNTICEELYSVKPKATCHVTRQSKHQCTCLESHSQLVLQKDYVKSKLSLEIKSMTWLPLSNATFVYISFKKFIVFNRKRKCFILTSYSLANWAYLVSLLIPHGLLHLTFSFKINISSKFLLTFYHFFHRWNDQYQLLKLQIRREIPSPRDKKRNTIALMKHFEILKAENIIRA